MTVQQSPAAPAATGPRSAGRVRSPRAAAPPDPRRWLAFAAVLLAGFMDLIDVTIVNVALPQIQRDLAASFAAVQWIVAGYALSFAILLITGGRLGDIFGRKRMFLTGVGGFVTASLVCGLAQDPGVLIGARFAQGAMAALMIPQVFSIVQVSFPARERPAALGLYGAAIGLAAVCGPLLGGVLTQADLFGFGWRSVFLINLPVGVLALVAAAILVRESRAPTTLRLDLVGVALVTLSLLALVYPLVRGRELGWPTWSLAAMGASVPLLGLFVAYERRKTRADGSPLVVLELFRQRSFVAGLLVVLAFFGTIAGFFLMFTLYLQLGLGFSVLRTGLAYLPFSLASVVGSGVSVPLATRAGRRLLAGGALLLVAAMAALIWTIGRPGDAITVWQLVPPLAVAGLGLGLVAPPLIDVILAGVPHRDAGSGSGLLTTCSQLGSAIGVAILGVVFFGQLGSQAGASIGAATPALRGELAAVGVPAPVREQIVAGVRVCFQDRAREQDPGKVPPSCQQAQRQLAAGPVPAGGAAPGGGGVAALEERVQRATASAAQRALAHNFAASMRYTLRWEVGAFGLAFLLMFLLPKHARQEHDELDLPYDRPDPAGV
jgi:EmrB/QacA subfamily drug resistance transporter